MLSNCLLIVSICISCIAFIMSLKAIKDTKKMITNKQNNNSNTTKNITDDALLTQLDKFKHSSFGTLPNSKNLINKVRNQ